jgi:hypothetical protein
MYGTGAAEKRQRGGRKAKKKKLQRQGDNQRHETDWDEIYDPSRPTNVDEYMKSDERIREVQEWKAILYAHRRRRRGSFDSDEYSDGDERPAMGSELVPEYSSGYNLANMTGPNRPIRSPGGLLPRTAAGVASPGLTSCPRCRAGPHNRRRCLRPATRAVRPRRSATASRSILSTSSSTAAAFTTTTFTRHRDNLSWPCSLRSPSSAIRTRARRRRRRR